VKKSVIIIVLLQLLWIVVSAQTHYGTGAGTSGLNHSYFGYYAGNAAQSSSSNNSFFGASSGRHTTTGYSNTAAGAYSLFWNSTGHSNSAAGNHALYSNTTGYANTATGSFALYSNTVGNYNVAAGFYALHSNTIGEKNTAVGSLALRSNTTGDRNTAAGVYALYNNTTGSDNTATGHKALEKNTTGIRNSAYGAFALSNSTGSYNSACGYSAWYSVVANCSGSYNSAFGANAGPSISAACTINNSTALGYNTRVTASNQIRIGNSSVTSIGGQVGWTVLSDGRFKRDLKNDVAGLGFIKQLRPVTYTLDREAIDKFLGIPDSLRKENAASSAASREQIGFIAQDVEAVIKKSGFVFSGVEAPQHEGDLYAIRYEEFVVPLVKAVQELNANSKAEKKEINSLAHRLHGNDPSAPSTVDAILFQNNAMPLRLEVSVPKEVTKANLIVSDLDGKRIKAFEITERGISAAEIPAGELSPGMYLYTLIEDDCHHYETHARTIAQSFSFLLYPFAFYQT
jgi:trimeric autotransporter adhesin